MPASSVAKVGLTGSWRSGIAGRPGYQVDLRARTAEPSLVSRPTATSKTKNPTKLSSNEK